MTIHRIIGAWLAATIMLAVLGAGGPASAQCDARAELERAAEFIEKARDEVRRSPVTEAKELLGAAESRLRQGAERALRGDRNNACRLARVSQQLAVKAAEVARRGNRVVSELGDILARTQEYLGEVTGRVGAAGPAEAQRFLKLAHNQQDEAKRAFRSDRLRLSLKLTLMARDTAARALRIAQGNPAEKPDAVRKALNETDRLLEEAARVVEESGEGASDPARELLQRAGRLQTEGRRHFDRNRIALALQLTRQARHLAMRALDRVDVEPDESDVATLIEVTGELLDRLRETAGEADDDHARDLLDRAGRLLQDARASLQNGEPRPALGSVRAASALALDVAERLGTPARN